MVVCPALGFGLCPASADAFPTNAFGYSGAIALGFATQFTSLAGALAALFAGDLADIESFFRLGLVAIVAFGAVQIAG